MFVLHDRAYPGQDRQDDPVLIPIERAIEIAVAITRPIDAAEDVAVHLARGRVLAADIHADRPMPAFDNSAMDGYAVRLADLPGVGPWRMPVSWTIAAGAEAPVGAVTPGSVLRIFTGARVPPGFDAVLMQEQCEKQGDHVRFHARPATGENIRRTGEDIAAGDRLAAAGTVIDARHVGLFAANGVSVLPVRRRPRIAVLSTGDELLDAGRRMGSIHDANRPMLLSLCETLGAEVTDLGICADDLDRTARLLRAQAGRFDMILTSGAASVGDKDCIRPALLAAGGVVGSCRVALKPGKPVFFGRLGDTLLTGLPGNPLSAYVCFQLFVTRQIGAMLGIPRQATVFETAIADFDWKRKPGRAEYLPARIVGRNVSGTAVVERLGHGSSAALLPLAEADGMVVLDALSSGGARGTPVGWIPFAKKDLPWRIA